MHGSDIEDGREQDGERLSGAFHRTVAGAEPDLGELVAAAAAQGRSLRRRRRAGVAGAVAAVLALTAGIGALQLSGGSGRQDAPAAASTTAPAPSRVSWNGKDALTGQGLLLALVDAMPQGTQLAGATGQLNTYPVAGGGAPLVHTEAWASGPNDGQGTQFLRATFDSDLAKYLAQPSVPDYVRSHPGPGGDEGLDCSTIEPGSSSEQVTCTPSTLPDGSRFRVVTRTASSDIAVSVVFARPDGATVALLMERENPPVGGGRPVPPAFTANQLKTVVQSPEIQTWVAPDFAARAATTVQPFVDTSVPTCPLGPGGTLTIMPSPLPTGTMRTDGLPPDPRPGGSSEQAPASLTPPGPGKPSAAPTPCASGSGSPGRPSGSPLPGGAVTSLVPVWPAR